MPTPHRSIDELMMAPAEVWCAWVAGDERGKADLLKEGESALRRILEGRSRGESDWVLARWYREEMAR